MACKHAKSWALWKWPNDILKLKRKGQMITRLKHCQFLSQSLTLLCNCFGFCREVVAGTATVEGKNVVGTTHLLSSLWWRNERENMVTAWKIHDRLLRQWLSSFVNNSHRLSALLPKPVSSQVPNTCCYNIAIARFLCWSDINKSSLLHCHPVCPYHSRSFCPIIQA